MPWKVFKTGADAKPFCVYRVDDDGERFGDSVGCHPSRAKANAHVRALYANVEETEMQEAATYRNRLLALMRNVDGLLADRTIPDTLRQSVTELRTALRRTWPELADEAAGDDEEQDMEGELAEATKKVNGESETGQPAALRENIVSFADLFAGQRTEAALNQVGELTVQFRILAENILFGPVDDRVTALRTLADEYIDLVSQVLGPVGTAQAADISPGVEAQEEACDECLAEAEAWDTALDVDVVGLQEDDGDDGKKVLYIDIVPIRPGWGNKRDNHYYPPDVVEKAAPIWKGAKMYATDHDPKQKSVLTEVSEVVESPVGHTDDGVPIARAVIYHPMFEEIVRKRQAAGRLASLHCSILAAGKAKPGYEADGRKGKLVTEITEAESIDWVTRAGAGGHALALSENEPEEVRMEGDQKQLETQETEEQEQEQPVEAQETNVVIHENDGAGEPAQQEPAPLAEAEVQAVLGSSNLPDVSRAKLAQGQYADQAALEEAVQAELDYVTALTGAGRPIGQTAKPAQAQEFNLAEALDDIDRRFGLKS